MLPKLISSKLFAGIHKITEGNVNTNTQPIIGVVTQELYHPLDQDIRFTSYRSFVESGYVEFLEGSGARVVPILETETDQETLEKMRHLDGVLFPGGNGDEMYKAKSQYIWEKAIEFNDSGQFFPLWGTCQGFEYMAIFAADEGDDVLSTLEAENISLNLKFVVDPNETKMFREASEKSKLFEEENVTVNFHSYGIAPDKFETDKGLKEMFMLTSISHDNEMDSTFAATMESPHYPFFGTQFHPEKQIYFWNDDMGYNHSWDSILLNRYLADTFIQQARENKNTVGDYAETQKVIVENADFFVTDYSTGNVYMFN